MAFPFTGRFHLLIWGLVDSTKLLLVGRHSTWTSRTPSKCTHDASWVLMMHHEYSWCKQASKESMNACQRLDTRTNYHFENPDFSCSHVKFDAHVHKNTTVQERTSETPSRAGQGRGGGAPDASWVLVMHHEYSWCSMSIHDASWVIMMDHEHPWCSMSTHDASLVHHEYSYCIIAASCEYSWCIMSAHDASDLSPNGAPWKLGGFQPNQSRWFVRARLCKFRDVQVPTFCVGVSIVLYAILKGSRSTHGSVSDHRGSIWRQPGTPRTILCWSDFSRNPKSWKYTFECSLWQLSTKLCAIDAESTPGHFQPSIYIKNSRYTAQAAVMLFKLDKARNPKKDTHAKPSKWPAPHHRSSGLCHRSGFWQRDNYQNPTHGQLKAMEFK